MAQYLLSMLPHEQMGPFLIQTGILKCPRLPSNGTADDAADPEWYPQHAGSRKHRFETSFCSQPSAQRSIALDMEGISTSCAEIYATHSLSLRWACHGLDWTKSNTSCETHVGASFQCREYQCLSTCPDPLSMAGRDSHNPAQLQSHLYEMYETHSRCLIRKTERQSHSSSLYGWRTSSPPSEFILGNTN